MTNTEADHECDLFLMSSHRRYFADRSLAEFARQGTRNVHGWGIGSYIDGTACVLRSALPAFQVGDHQLSREFAIAIEAVSSPVILGHLRLKSRGLASVENNHPFRLPFLGYDWLLVHNGTAHNADRLVANEDRLLVDSTGDTARVFEYLRHHIIDYSAQRQSHSLIEACRSAFDALLRADSGTFNLILSNGYLTFVLAHWRTFYVLHRGKDGGDATIVSTIRLSEDEEWQEFESGQGRTARMLVFSRPSLVLNGDVPR